MKNIKLSLLALIATCLLLIACKNNKVSNAEMTEMPVTTSSLDAEKAFAEGLTLLDLGNRILARNAFTEALRTDKNFGMAYLMRAETATSAKEYGDDLAMGKDNVGNASKWEKWYAEAMATTLTGNREKRLEFFQKIATEYPMAARAQAELGFEYGADLQVEKARESFAKAISLNPKWVGGYSGMANSCLFDKPIDLKKAEENALKMVEISPLSSGMHIVLGDVYRARNDFAKARDAYTKAVEMDDKNPAGYYKLGHTNTYLGNFEEARKNYADAGAKDIRKGGSILYTAYTWLYANDAKAATKYIMDQMAAVPDMNTSEKNSCLNTIAEIALHYNDAAMLTTAVNLINPLNDQINRDLGNSAEIRIYGAVDSLHWQSMLAMVNKNYNMARAEVENMKKRLDPITDKRKLEGYEHDMGLIELKQNNFNEAISHFTKANRNDMYNKYCLALAYEGAGNKAAADALYREVAAYNFNETGNALIRNEVKKKLEGI